MNEGSNHPKPTIKCPFCTFVFFFPNSPKICHFHQQVSVAVAHWAHNPKVLGSNPRLVILFCFFVPYLPSPCLPFFPFSSLMLVHLAFGAFSIFLFLFAPQKRLFSWSLFFFFVLFLFSFFHFSFFRFFFFLKDSNNFSQIHTKSASLFVPNTTNHDQQVVVGGPKQGGKHPLVFLLFLVLLRGKGKRKGKGK